MPTLKRFHECSMSPEFEGVDHTTSESLAMPEPQLPSTDPDPVTITPRHPTHSEIGHLASRQSQKVPTSQPQAFGSLKCPNLGI